MTTTSPVVDSIHCTPAEQVNRRNAADATTRAVRHREVMRSLEALNLWAEVKAMEAAQAEGNGALLVELAKLKTELLRLRDVANATGGHVAPIRSAIDRLGALWVVVS